MRWLNVGIEFHVISTAPPGVSRAAQQVLYLIDVALHLPETLNRNVDKRILFAMRVKIHNDENDVITCSRHLAVKQNGVVVGIAESQIDVKLRRAVFLSHFI